MLDEGSSADEISQSLGVPRGNVAAVLAGRKLRAGVKARANFAGQHPDPKTSSAELSIPVGRDSRSGDIRYWRPGRDSGLPNPHLMIMGESGTGKTYSTQCLCAEFVQRKIPVIVFDFGQGFVIPTAPEEFAQYAYPVEIEAAREGISISPLTIFNEDIHGPVNVAQRIADTFARIYHGVGVQQHAVLREAIIEVFARAGIHSSKRETWSRPPPPFVEVKDILNEMAGDRQNPNRKYASSVASHISTLFVFDTFRSGGVRLNWGDLISSGDHTYIIQLRGLEYNLERLVTELLLWNFIGFIEDQGPAPLRCLLVLDEAHRLSFAATSPIEKLLREARKFGVGVVLASQQPADFSPVAFSNTATKIIFSVSDPKGDVARYLSNKSDQKISSQQLKGLLARLKRGSAVYSDHMGSSIITVSSFGERAVEWQLRNAHQLG
jgi:DNA phosphorothioation-dependent restriction protein DptH